MRVAQHSSATWRGRTNTLDLNNRAIEVVRAVTDNVEGMWKRLAASSRAVYTRLQKARSETQQPSALARVFEEILALYAAGVSKERLNIYVVETANIVASLDGPASITAQRVLESMHVANLAGCEEQVAESMMALRADRVIGAATSLNLS